MCLFVQNTVTRGQGDLEAQLEEAKAKLLAATSELTIERKKSAKQQVIQSRLLLLLFIFFSEAVQSAKWRVVD
jgi:hypothetical protein